jgi:hypothetical protein
MILNSIMQGRGRERCEEQELLTVVVPTWLTHHLAFLFVLLLLCENRMHVAHIECAPF